MVRIYRQTWPPQTLALVPGINQTRLDPFSNDGSLKFRKGSQQVKQELPGRGGTVKLFVEGYERHTEALELVQGHDEMLETPAQTVEPPDEHDVHLPPPTCAEQSIEGGTCGLGA